MFRNLLERSALVLGQWSEHSSGALALMATIIICREITTSGTIIRRPVCVGVEDYADIDLEGKSVVILIFGSAGLKILRTPKVAHRSRCDITIPTVCADVSEWRTMRR